MSLMKLQVRMRSPFGLPSHISDCPLSLILLNWKLSWLFAFLSVFFCFGFFLAFLTWACPLVFFHLFLIKVVFSIKENEIAWDYRAINETFNAIAGHWHAFHESPTNNEVGWDHSRRRYIQWNVWCHKNLGREVIVTLLLLTSSVFPSPSVFFFSSNEITAFGTWVG